jgi:hypothetical protein
MQKLEFKWISEWQAQAKSACYYLSCRVRFWRTELSRYAERRHLHRGQASQQKSCREPLPVHLAINLVWRFVDAVGFQEACQFLVAKFPFPHLHDQQVLGAVLPGCVGSLRTQFQRSSHTLWWRCRTAHRALGLHDSKGKKLKIGLIRPNSHFNVVDLPTRSHQQLLQVSDVG